MANNKVVGNIAAADGGGLYLMGHLKVGRRGILQPLCSLHSYQTLQGLHPGHGPLLVFVPTLQQVGLAIVLAMFVMLSIDCQLKLEACQLLQCMLLSPTGTLARKSLAEQYCRPRWCSLCVGSNICADGVNAQQQHLGAN